MDDSMRSNETKHGRLPNIQYDALSTAQKAAHDAIASGPRGKVEGPLAIWIMNPVLAEKLQQLGSYCRFGSALPPRLSELAIIIVGAFWKADFEWCAHAPIAEKAGISLTVIEAIRLQRAPKFVRDDEAALYYFLRSLLEEHQVPDAIYQNLIREVGQTAAIDLVGIAGYYGSVCMTLNAFCVPLPDDLVSPFFGTPQPTS